ncbi:iron ABC transporter substrate-binding protein [Rhodoferax koreense]|uniref:Iron ABC transporter substrate-binding protein n=1 Tax=Rhodoferax koreensis TaxID=1842727 RepID=A0A1P8JZI9_9BURK|nr:iron ABC transporter substrate-binding protein [Rhodoferax koreense]APW39111.1 iron ABC transporter substrate-binding protein [Rhodoferax koreense]
MFSRPDPTRRSLLLALGLGVSTGAAVFAPLAAQAQGSDGLVIYNAQHVSLTRSWVEQFTRDTGIKVTVRDGGDYELANQILQEGAASPADIFLTENSPAMTMVDNRKLFAPLDEATLAQVPPAFRPADGHWTGIAARSTVFAYRKIKFTRDTLPKSIMDLADPAWKGRIGAAPAGADFQAIVSAVLQLKGEAATAAWLKGLKENLVTFRGNSVAMKAVNDGEIDGAVIYHYYYFGDMAKRGENTEKLGLHYFRNQDPGAFVSVSGGGILASSKRQPQAQAFMKWLTGKGGQDILRTGSSYEYAVGVGAASNRNLVPLAELQAPAVDMSTLKTGETQELMRNTGLL